MRILACLLIVFSPTLFAALTSQHGTHATSPPPAQVLSAPVPKTAVPDGAVAPVQAAELIAPKDADKREPKL